MFDVHFHPIVAADDHPYVLPIYNSTVKCGSCGRWLQVDEEELLASLDHPLRCWSCDSVEAQSTS